MTSTPQNSDPLLTVDDVAGYLGASSRFVRREIAAGRLIGTRLGRLLRVRQSAVENYISRAATVSEEQPWERG